MFSATSRGIWVVALMVCLTLLAACSASPAPPPTTTAGPPEIYTPTPLPSISPAELDEEMLRSMVRWEGEFVVAKDLDALMRMWLPDGYVADANHTPSDPSDDLTWKGQYAIRDRYITLVFPGNATQVEPRDLILVIEGDRAVITSTTHIGAELSPAGDRWTFVRAPEGWKIESLTYNLEARP